MKLGQLKKKVIKEFAKSPAKTITLIALCPVALYFIVPLILPGKPSGDQAQMAKVIAPNVVPSATLASFSPMPPVRQGPTWNQLNGWIDADWRRKPGLVAMDQRNPFQTPSVPVEAIVDAPPEKPVAIAALSQEAFAAMGLKLTGTLVGRHSRSATINGRRYLEGSKVKLMPNEQVASASVQALVLKHIGARHAILEMAGARYCLELDATRPLGNGITLVRGPASEDN